jgi:hypothetical protein
MVQTGEKWNTRGDLCQVPLFPSESSHGLVLDRNRASAMKSRRLTAWTMAELWRLTQVYIVHKKPIRISRRPLRASIIKTSW